jgi:hypothetical protein
MWTKTHSSIYKGIKKEDVWHIWLDVTHWPIWDKELAYCQMDMPFEKGSHITLKPLNGPKVKILLEEVIPNKKFTASCHFLGATMQHIHELQETPDGICITNTLCISGLLSFIWVHLVGKKIIRSIPANNDALIKLIKSS